MKNLILFIVLILFTVLQFGCEDETKILSPEQQETKLQFTLSDVDSPGDSAKYSMWAAYDSADVSLTKFIADFRIDDQGNTEPGIFDINLGVIQKSTTLVISIEQADSTPVEASNFRVLAAKLVANSAVFSVGDEYLLDFDVPSATGAFQVVRAPGTDSVKGIWFMTGDTLKEAGLNLPETAPGWRYQGFVVVNGDTFPTGNFSRPGAADSENKYGLNLPTYPFPGQNFEIDPVDSTALNIDLRGAQVMIKIAPPVPTFSKKPFELIMFLGTIPTDATENITYQLTNNSAGFPGGNAQLIIKLFE